MTTRARNPGGAAGRGVALARRPSTTLRVMCALAAAAVVGARAHAQPRAPAPQPPEAARQSPIDLTGQWVAVVNEDWRWRMVTPPKGDYASVPLNADGRAVADGWDPSRDGACEAYGAAGLMRMPTRLRIAWEGDETLRIETDAGRQTRRLVFAAAAAPAAPSLQGRSTAAWVRPMAPASGPGLAGAGGGAARSGGYLKVTTTDMLPGWLRRNGVPYSENAKLTEYFDRFRAPNGDEWLMVTSIVDDPTYLTTPFITSSHFRREPEGGNWNPQACGAGS